MSRPVLAAGLVNAANEAALPALREDYDALGAQLARRFIDLERITEAAGRFSVALPSWGVGTGGTRFARFPGLGEPRDIFDKLADCAAVHQLTAMTPRVSPHFPWDTASDPAELRAYAESLGLGFDAVNSNTFQDSPGQALSYKFGSLSHTDPAVRAQAVAHNLDCIRLGESLGAKALTVWIGDGANFPGQQSLAGAFERYLESVAQIYVALPPDWRLLLEYKFYEPALYATVMQDWGSALLAAQATGKRAAVLVDLGHHAPGTNIEQVVARLIHAGRLGGFHLNDSKYGDDDLDAGAIAPYRLFLIFNELVDAARRERLAHGTRLHAGSVAQRDGPDREPVAERDRGGTRLCPGMPRRPRRTRGRPGGERCASGHADSETCFHHGCRPDPGHGALSWRRSH